MNASAGDAQAYPPAFEAISGNALLLRLGETLDIDCNRRVLDLARLLRERSPEWLVDLVPAYASLAVFFDASKLPGEDPHAAVAAALAAMLTRADADTRKRAARRIELPVCYDPALAADLAECAATLGLSIEALADAHASATYTVAMIGFAPGFPYLLGMPESLSLPRLDTPRTEVPAGSVAIGGSQTGVYPRASPGGWRLIGRTPERLFDAARPSPCLLQPGDEVAFRPIDRARFEALSR